LNVKLFIDIYIKVNKYLSQKLNWIMVIFQRIPVALTFWRRWRWGWQTRFESKI